MMPFSGKRLQELRKAAGLSQSELATKANVPLQSLQGWEGGRRNPKTDALLSLAQALQVELAELITGAGKTKPRGKGAK
jgi:transcriptional regulator with XRE-family HTH domain